MKMYKYEKEHEAIREWFYFYIELFANVKCFGF